MEDEFVVLVDEKNNVLGTALKSEVHTANTPRHRAFSCFIFNQKGELLLQQRSHLKQTWPLIWSNSCCGHPGLNEENIDAVKRRLQVELNLHEVDLHEVLPGYRYKAELYGIVENEICPVFVGFTSELPKANPAEVESIQWILWSDFLKEIGQFPDKYSAWCKEEAELLDKSELFQKLLERNRV